MAKKKSKSKSASPNSAQRKSSKHSMSTWIVVAGVAAAIVVVVVLASGGGAPGQEPTSEEAAYIGRLLPVGYSPPAVAERTLYTQTIPMTVIPATTDASGYSIALSDVLDKKIVRFDYTRTDGRALPMIAYVKPSGDLFTGISYCPPCEGEAQSIAGDGTLTCGSCGTKRNLESNAGVSGACKLYPLDEVPVTIDADRVLIDTGVLDSWVSQPLDRPVG